jgi:hypothetical protein
MSSSSVYNTIKVNVGGKIFETYNETLMKSSYFKSLFTDTEVKEMIFVDYDPDVFNHVLSYLRDPKYLFDIKYVHALDFFDVQYDINNLYNEEYIQCHGFVHNIDKRCNNTIRSSPYYKNDMYYCNECKNNKICKRANCGEINMMGGKYCLKHVCNKVGCPRVAMENNIHCQEHSK